LGIDFLINEADVIFLYFII